MPYSVVTVQQACSTEMVNIGIACEPHNFPIIPLLVDVDYSTSTGFKYKIMSFAVLNYKVTVFVNKLPDYF